MPDSVRGAFAFWIKPYTQVTEGYVLLLVKIFTDEYFDRRGFQSFQFLDLTHLTSCTTYF